MIKNNKISFVIVNYNSTAELQKCLEDLSNIKNSTTFQVIVVNNDSKKLSLKQHSFATQKIIEINKNIGYGSACNIGLKNVTTRYVCFLNPDTHSFCNNLCEITSFIKTNTTIVAPQLLTVDNHPEKWSVGNKITLTQLIKNNLRLHKKNWLSKNEIIVSWVSGAALFSTTKFIKELGGFDEKFFLYFEDADLCQRAYQNGGVVKYIPYFNLVHTSGASSKKASKNQKKCYYNSQDLFFKKHLSTTSLYLMRLCRFFHTK